MSRPLSNGHGVSAECQKPIVPAVIILNGFSFPGTILRAVASVVVSSFNRMLWGWTWPHVGVKQSKVIPTVAYSNSPAAIIFPKFVGFFLAPSFHVRPNFVFRCFAKTMSRLPCRRQFAPKAAAGFGVAAGQVASEHARFFATIAQAIPKIISFAAFSHALPGQFYNNEPVKSESAKVSKLLVGGNLAWNDWKRFDSLHIVFSRGRFLTGESAFAL